MRSAIAQAADVGARQAAHRKLVEVLGGQPDRLAWHRAAAASGIDESVAVVLELVADRAQRRAVSKLERAAGLSEAPVERLLRAADLAVEAGRRDVVDRLLLDVATGDSLWGGMTTPSLSTVDIDACGRPARDEQRADDPGMATGAAVNLLLHAGAESSDTASSESRHRRA